MKKLTERQKQILELIRHHIQQTGFPPTRAEIAQHLGFRSANAAEDHLRALERKGVLKIIAGTSRGLQLLLEETEPEPKGLPLIGRVAAGVPLLAVEHIEEYYPVDSALFRPRAHFLLKVQGFSMKNVGIYDGDLVAVSNTQEVRNGQIVVARIDDEVTVKRWRRNGNSVTLFPENNDFSPLIIDLTKQSLNIEGVVVGLIRQSFNG